MFSTLLCTLLVTSLDQWSSVTLFNPAEPAWVLDVDGPQEFPLFLQALEAGTLPAGLADEVVSRLRAGQVEPLPMVDGYRNLLLIHGTSEPETASAGRMRLYCGRASTQKPFSITVYLKSPGPEQTVTLQLPEGLALADNQPAEQRVPPLGEKGYAQVVWRVKASKPGEFAVTVTAPGIGKAEETIRVLESNVI